MRRNTSVHIFYINGSVPGQISSDKNGSVPAHMSALCWECERVENLTRFTFSWSRWSCSPFRCAPRTRAAPSPISLVFGKPRSSGQRIVRLICVRDVLLRSLLPSWLCHWVTLSECEIGLGLIFSSRLFQPNKKRRRPGGICLALSIHNKQKSRINCWK